MCSTSQTTKRTTSQSWKRNNVHNEVIFTDNHDGTTKMTIRSQPFNASDEERSFFEGMLESMQQGFGGTFDQLEQYLVETQ
ncbi:SRPBCC domain-containing protein [Paenibacillus terricola]|uniref:SRPBCC domain-containing protein n=1 Tax=Paenibacillus terricola TaxID=2763503 RepID=UPI00296420BE|nr:SRPBCC domain-containing protein [Paenibacillus terricola]